MAELTKLSNTVITEYGGNYKTVVLDLDGATGTTGTATATGISTFVTAWVNLKEVPTADCNFGIALTSTANPDQLNVILYEDDGVTACTQTAIDVTVVAIGHNGTT